MPLSIAEFFERLEASGLLPPDEFRALLARVPERKRTQDAEKIVPKLVEAGRLTAFQAEALVEDRGQMLVLGDYVLLYKIGAGGMGQVFKARHRRMKRLVALKVLPGQVTEKPEAVKRFQREVEAAAKLSHANIVAAYDAGEQKGIYYLVMEYVDGEDLQRRVQKYGPLDVATAHSYIVQTALGLAHAHEQGVIHRDIKPANLLVDPHGVVKILDMGLARFEGLEMADANETDLTQSGSLMGTVDYMSPEQALDTKTADVRSDVYSLGCTLFFLLTGRRMYDGDTMMKRVVAHREHPIPSLALERPDAPAALVEVFKKMVAKRRRDRYQNMAELLAALAACRPEAAPSAARPAAIGGAVDADIPTGVVLGSSVAGEPSAASVIPLADESVSGLPPAPPVPPPFQTEQTIAGQAERETQVRGPLVTPATPQFAPRGASGQGARPAQNVPPALVGVLALSVAVFLGLAALGWYVLTRPSPDEDLARLLAESKKVAERPNLRPRKSGGSPVAPPAALPAAGEVITNSIGMKLAFIPGGLFQMGSPDDELGHTDEEFAHEVDLTRNFYLGVYEVTQAQYQTIMGVNPSHFSATGAGQEKVSGLDTSEFPVESVSWEDAREFCRRLTAREGKTYRLPTEAEWEYAARANTETPFHFGGQLNGNEANCDGNFPYGASAKGPFLERTALVGSYLPNAFNLCDMHGNVREWCADWHGAAYYRESPLEDPPGPSFGATKVTRGGGWSLWADACRAAHRDHLTPTQKDYHHGFRVAREP